ncbi:hypothetical protein TNCV_4197351 [Trichonephila clavipes]|nr:hypothetical protein TNCV_4197351 [Trichonephila clavipes]
MASGRISGFVEEDRKQMARPPERRRPHETAIVTSHRHRFLARRVRKKKIKGNKKGKMGVFRTSEIIRTMVCGGLPRLVGDYPHPGDGFGNRCVRAKRWYKKLSSLK